MNPAASIPSVAAHVSDKSIGNTSPTNPKDSFSQLLQTTASNFESGEGSSAAHDKSTETVQDPKQAASEDQAQNSVSIQKGDSVLHQVIQSSLSSQEAVAVVIYGMGAPQIDKEEITIRKGDTFLDKTHSSPVNGETAASTEIASMLLMAIGGQPVLNNQSVAQSAVAITNKSSDNDLPGTPSSYVSLDAGTRIGVGSAVKSVAASSQSVDLAKNALPMQNIASAAPGDVLANSKTVVTTAKMEAPNTDSPPPDKNPAIRVKVPLPDRVPRLTTNMSDDKVLQVDAAPMKADEPRTHSNNKIVSTEKPSVSSPQISTVPEETPASKTDSDSTQLKQTALSPDGERAAQPTNGQTDRDWSIGKASTNLVHGSSEEVVSSRTPIGQSASSYGQPVNGSVLAGTGSGIQTIKTEQNQSIHTAEVLTVLSSENTRPDIRSIAMERSTTLSSANQTSLFAVESTANNQGMDDAASGERHSSPDSQTPMPAHAQMHQQVNTPEKAAESTAPPQFDLQRKQVIDQVTRHLDTMRLTQGRQELTIHLQPENLGNLHLKIVTDRDTVTASFVAQTSTACHAVEESREQLRTALEQKGYNLKGLDVSLQQNGGQGSFQPFFGQEYRNFSRAFVPTIRENSENKLDHSQIQATTFTAQVRGNGHLDYRV